MGVISTVATSLAALVGALSSRLAYDELKAWSPRLVDRLVSRAVVKLPEAQRERMAEEWASHINDTPGDVGKLLAAIGFARAARTTRRPTPLIDLLRFCLLRDFSIERGLFIRIAAEKHQTMSVADQRARYMLHVLSMQLSWMRLCLIRSGLLDAFIHTDMDYLIQSINKLEEMCNRRFARQLDALFGNED